MIYCLNLVVIVMVADRLYISFKEKIKDYLKKTNSSRLFFQFPTAAIGILISLVMLKIHNTQRTVNTVSNVKNRHVVIFCEF